MFALCIYGKNKICLNYKTAIYQHFVWSAKTFHCCLNSCTKLCLYNVYIWSPYFTWCC